MRVARADGPLHQQIPEIAEIHVHLRLAQNVELETEIETAAGLIGAGEDFGIARLFQRRAKGGHDLKGRPSFFAVLENRLSDGAFRDREGPVFRPGSAGEANAVGGAGLDAFDRSARQLELERRRACRSRYGQAGQERQPSLHDARR